jgi:hypothetical protein
VLIGCFYHLILANPYQSFSLENNVDSITVALKLYTLGVMIEVWFGSFILSGAVDRLLLAMGLPPPFENAIIAVQASWVDLLVPVEGEALTQALSRFMLYVWTLFVHPLALGFCSSMSRALIVMIVDKAILGGISLLPFTSLPVGSVVLFAETLVWVGRVLLFPVSFWLRWYYTSIKDEYYLEGTILLNSSEVPPPLSLIYMLI